MVGRIFRKGKFYAAREDPATAIGNTHKNFVKIGHVVPKI